MAGRKKIERAEFLPGTTRWLRGEATWGYRGKWHAALRLLSQGEISERRCLELLRELETFNSNALNAPWDKLDWGSTSAPRAPG